MQQGFFLNTNNELSPFRVMLVAGLISAIVILSVAAISAAYPVSAAGLLALTVAASVLVASLLFYLVIVPVAHQTAPATTAEHATLTTIDPLTRTLNRQGITSSLLEAMALAQRYSIPLSVALLRVDDFPKLRESHGKKATDSKLQAVSQTVSEVIRLPDRVGRYGDDEFLLVMPQTLEPAAAMVGERVRAAIEAGAHDGLPATVSIGIAHYDKGQDLEKLLSNAQTALDKALAHGNEVVRHPA